MAKQTYISYLQDSNGNMITFERWAYKKPGTIIRALKQLYSTNYIIKRDLERAKTVAIYATPDGYNRDSKPVLLIPIEALAK